ncbi:MAG TPA: transglycosylase domain-containing protein [Candidatus Limnocylindria bacterium]|nr:transglycosylase domain-containing protein [Candidatus Limnocylindria bacterium]
MRRTTSRRAPRRGMVTAFLVLVGLFGLSVLATIGGTAGGGLLAYNAVYSSLPDGHLLDGIQLPASTYVYDRTGKVLLARFECQNREQVSFDEVPKDVVNASVAAEDRTFWTNDGVDYPAIVRAALANYEAGSVVQGASTITQQVIKYAGSIKLAEEAAAHPSGSAAPSAELDPNATSDQNPDLCAPPRLTFLESDRKLWDKVQEAVMAKKLTDAYPGRAGKEKILETYMNLIFYGNGSYGIKAAAANYFGIENLSDLSLAQSAFLAGLPQLPSVYDPYYNNQGPKRGMARRDQVLRAMRRDNYITDEQMQKALAVTWAQMKPSRITSVLREPHFSFRVAREAESILAAQGVPNPEEAVRTGGYRITTTLDYKLQQFAKNRVSYWVHYPTLADKNVNNGALVAIDSATGEIVAYVGSVDYYDRKDPRVRGQFDVAGLGVRQPGSAFKPIVYSSAFRAREATPATFFVDNVTQFGADRATSYLPTNADIKEHGPLLAMDSLRYSLNVPSVMMQYLVGVNETAKFAESMGIASKKYILDQDPGLTLGLGSVPVNLTNMTGAYSVFAAQGVLHQPTTILEIRDRDGRIIYSLKDNGPKPTHPMTKAEAFLTHWIIEGNTNPQTNVLWGPRAQLLDNNGVRRHAGFKTGTTNDFRDVSGFGYVPGSLVTGVWMGNNNQEPMSNILGQGLFSADGPLYLWQDFMSKALNKRWAWDHHKPVPQTNFPMPQGVVMEKVCRFSGMAATSSCGQTLDVPFLEGTTPPPDNVHSKGCFDIVQEIRNDDRRPQEWIDSAQQWADRLVNGQLGSVGDPTQLKENTSYRLAIAPVLGNTGYGQPICGHVIATPRPTKNPHDSGGPSPSGGGGGGNNCQGNPHKCTPNETLPLAPTAATGTSPVDVAMLLPVFAISAGAWLLPLIGRRRRRRRG